ncbi:hypothetical protein SS50377_27944 [Spironucleus salmonicida]|uniref:Uncharacterized protein n=1 Tax=Spironucleus salmonicida TaxID=348837 RepID=V6LFM2_9EUKA|nr:hypothetical protein SS50377_27944 [Spironucleus salmonicida]|eukprot:EST42506.1 Hypothetical protein SS50377_17812 [Spironucleus salmonicida]
MLIEVLEIKQQSLQQLRKNFKSITTHVSNITQPDQLFTHHTNNLVHRQNIQQVNPVYRKLAHINRSNRQSPLSIQLFYSPMYANNLPNQHIQPIVMVHTQIPPKLSQTTQINAFKAIITNIPIHITELTQNNLYQPSAQILPTLKFYQLQHKHRIYFIHPDQQPASIYLKQSILPNPNKLHYTLPIVTQ